jgi:hypothetical protein
MFDPQPKQPCDVKADRITRFMCHPERCPVGGLDKVLRDELLRWHPDKFNASILTRVVAEEILSVKEAVNVVTCTLTEMKRTHGGR